MKQLEITVKPISGGDCVVGHKGRATQPVVVNWVHPDGVARAALAVQACPVVGLGADECRQLHEGLAEIEAMLTDEKEEDEAIIIGKLYKLRQLLPDFEKIGEPIGENLSVPVSAISPPWNKEGTPREDVAALMKGGYPEQHPEGLDDARSQAQQSHFHDRGTSRLERALETGTPIGQGRQAGCPDCGSPEHESCRS